MYMAILVCDERKLVFNLALEVGVWLIYDGSKYFARNGSLHLKKQVCMTRISF